MLDPISTPIHQVLDLFATDLAEVKFADVEADVLTRAAEHTKMAADAVAAAEAALEAARAVLAEKQEALLAKAQRALAYARVYAEDDSALAARIDAIPLLRMARRLVKTQAEEGLTLATDAAPPRRRGRPRNSDRNGPLLEMTTGLGPEAPCTSS